MGILNLKDEYKPNRTLDELPKSNNNHPHPKSPASKTAGFIPIMIGAFMLGIVKNEYDVTIPLSQLNQAFIAGLAFAVFVLLFAGIPAAIASIFTEKWHLVFYMGSAIVLVPFYLVYALK